MTHNTNEREDWEKRLSFNFLQDGIVRVTIDGVEIRSICTLEDFIDEIIQSHDNQLVAEIEGMKKPGLTVPIRPGVIGTKAINWEWNQALDQAINIIKPK